MASWLVAIGKWQAESWSRRSSVHLSINFTAVAWSAVKLSIDLPSIDSEQPRTEVVAKVVTNLTNRHFLPNDSQHST